MAVKATAAANGKASDKKWAAVSLEEFINSNSENDSDGEDDSGSDDASDGDFDEEMSGEEAGDEGDEEDDGKEAGEDEDHSDEEEEDEGSSGGEDDDQLAAKKHKKTLEKLKSSDPEFYKFLSENDKELLEFDTSDSEDETGGQVHKPSSDLEEASDDSDFEDKESAEKRAANVITQAMVDEWQQQLQSDK